MDIMQTFTHPEFGEIRVVDMKGSLWFVGKDIATALGYGNPRDALANHVDKEEKAVSLIPTASGTQKMTVINEDGLLRLIFSNKRPIAKKFKSWIDRDVLPALREHGNPVENDDITSEPFKNSSNMVEKCALQIFENPEFGQVRMLKEGEKVLFCGKDIAIALGYSNTNDALARHCRGVVKRDITDNLGRQQETSFIPESDVYRLLAHSKLPTAVQFERWVFEEVLPSIRKHGLYAIDELVKNPKLLRSVVDELIREKEQREALEAENIIQKQVIAELEPIKRYVDVILSSNQALAITQIAADYGLSGRRLNQILHDEGVQWKVSGQWVLYQKYQGQGYTESETISITRSNGSPDTKLFTKWTQKGRLLIHKILTERGIMAKMDISQNAA